MFGFSPKVMEFWLLFFVFGASSLEGSESRAHHKVHNLALYPERHSWCIATKIQQEIAHPPECSPKIIDNMVCIGACFSYSVPRAQDLSTIQLSNYCDKCDKTYSSWTVVTLDCKRQENGEDYKLTRNVELITNCSCVDCNDSGRRVEEEGNDEDEEELPADSLVDLPENHHLNKGILRHLKSESSEHKKVGQQMIQDNRIPGTDDDEQEDEEIVRLEKMKESLLVGGGDHDL